MLTRPEQETRRRGAAPAREAQQPREARQRSVPSRTGPRRPGAAAPRPRPATAGAARPARAARPATGRQRAPFLLLVVGLLCGGLVSLLILNTVLNQDSFIQGTLQEQIEDIRQRNEQLRLANEGEQQPDALSEKAGLQGQLPNWKSVDGLVNGRVASENENQVGQNR